MKTDRPPAEESSSWGMHRLAQHISGRNVNSWLRRTAILGRFTGIQVVAQVFNALSGFLIVRTMEKPDYALFTIASSMNATITVLSDSGIAWAALSIGGEVWQDRSRFSRLLHEALQLRWTLSLIAGSIVIPWSLWLLTQNGAGWGQATLITTLTILSFWPAASTAILTIANRLHSRVKEIQRSELLLAGARLLITTGFAVLGWLTTGSAMAAVMIACSVQLWLVQRQVRDLSAYVPSSDSQTESFRPRLLGNVRYMLPNSIFQCLQGSLTVWLLTWFASIKEVADIGALGRLAFIYVLFGAPLNAIISPAFARCNDIKRLRKLFLLTLGAYGVFGIGVLLFCALWPEIVLSLLGEKYQHLHSELLIYMLGLTIMGLNGVCVVLILSKGWVRYLWLNIPAVIATQIGACFTLSLDTVYGAAWFNSCFAIASIATTGPIVLANLRDSLVVREVITTDSVE